MSGINFTAFVSAIPATWLNAINGAVYGALADVNGIPPATPAQVIANLGLVPGTVYAGATGSSLIGFQQFGTGAVVRSLQSKGRDVVNAADFGADPTGASPAGAAILLAATSFAGGKGQVNLDPGTFLLTSSLVLPSGVLLVGQGFSQSLGTGAGNRGATCLLRGFTGTQPTVALNGDACGLDLLDVDGNLQGTGDGIQIWGSRCSLGTVSSRNHGGWGWRTGQTAAGPAAINANFWNAGFVTCLGNLLGGAFFNDTNTTTSTTYPIGLANANAGFCAALEVIGNGVAYTITGITQAANAVVTINSPSATNPFTVRDAPGFANIGGMTQLNGLLQSAPNVGVYVTAVGGSAGAWTATLNVNSTGFTPYTAGGQVTIGDGLRLANCNGNVFGQVLAETNGVGIRFWTDGTNSGPRTNTILSNDSEMNVGPDILSDGATLPASGPGLYNKIYGNLYVQVNPRIVDGSTGNLVMQWNGSLTPGERAYHFGETLNVVNPVAAGLAKVMLYADTNLANVGSLRGKQTGTTGGQLSVQTKRDGNTPLDAMAWDNLQNTIFSGQKATAAVAPTIASAATIAPTKDITFISGVTAVVTITPPTPFAAGGGSLTLIPTGAWSTTTAGNIALVTVAVPNKALIMTYDSATAKWYPSY